MTEESAAGSIADLLVNSGLVSEEAMAEANRRRIDEEKTLCRVLMEMGAVDEDRKLSLFKQRFGHEIVSLEDLEIDPRVLGLLPRSFCERHMVAPILRERGKLYIAMEDPSDVVVIDETRGLLEVEIHPVIASSKDILEALEQYPAKDDEGQIVGLEATAGEKLKQGIHMAILFVAFLLPLLVMFALLVFSGSAQDSFNKALDTLDNFELSLFIFLSWSLWAVTVYEVNGLLFGAPQNQS